MKICCSQEHYDKVVQYAKSINDKTLENCLERLKQWEKNENRPSEQCITRQKKITLI